MRSGYREEPAPAALAGVVACLWRDHPRSLREQRVLPDGCIDLIWMDGTVSVAGPDTRAFLATLRGGQEIVGLRFRPGAAPGVLGVPAWVLRDRRVPLGDLWPGSALLGQVANSPDPAAGLAAVVRGRAVAPDPALREMVARLHTGCGIAATADAMGCTERALHRRCRDAFGYGPSVLRRILRFRAALRLAHQGVPFAATAHRTGYADQAHLSREVRALAGVPLGELVGRRPAGPQSGSGANRSTDTPSGSCTTA